MFSFKHSWQNSKSLEESRWSCLLEEEIKFKYPSLYLSYSKFKEAKKEISEFFQCNDFEELDFEYEMYLESKPGDVIKIDTWVPIQNEMIPDGRLDQLIKKGLLRKIEK